MPMDDAERPVRKSLAPDRMLIDNAWRDAASGETTLTTDPTTEAVITTVARCAPAEADEAVDAASRASEHGPWSRMHHEERAKILFRMADLMDERADDFVIDTIRIANDTPYAPPPTSRPAISPAPSASPTGSRRGRSGSTPGTNTIRTRCSAATR